MVCKYYIFLLLTLTLKFKLNRHHRGVKADTIAEVAVGANARLCSFFFLALARLSPLLQITIRILILENGSWSQISRKQESL